MKLPSESDAVDRNTSGPDTAENAHPYDPFKLAARRISRTSMLSGLVVTSALLGAACSSNITPAVLGAGGGAGSDSLGIGPDGKYSDIDIVNFALNLEYLEAEFYNVAVHGKTIEQMGVKVNGVGNRGPTTGGKKVDISDKTEAGVSDQIANDELTHVEFLRSVLGNKAIAKPAINLDALGIGFANSMQFLVLARAFEDTGVSAYGGAAPLISSKEILGAAARILATEAQHTGSIRTMIAQMHVSTNPPGRLDKKDKLPPPSGHLYFDVNQDGLSQIRTFSEVIAIAKPFFPNGINGNIQ
ncbi:MAG TPA: ferritin-like domain-containing protein [Candidatus Tumulicola sp.]